MTRFLVTGGAGFIGSAVVRHLIGETEHEVLVVDKLTYAGNLDNLAPVGASNRYRFLKADIGDQAAMQAAFAEFRPEIVMNLAAESHVDRSIDGPAAFVETNVVGTFVLLQASLAHWRGLPEAERRAFRFHHVSTDEVFGALGRNGQFTETTPYDPTSPYSASKAASDHFVRAWGHTYGLPILVSNCSNNYGPHHFPEKLIPLMILSAIEGRELPVYGDGSNVRDWLYVEDHARALTTIALKGEPGRSYNVGGNAERSNLTVVKSICALVDQFAPRPDGRRSESLIRFVADRPGHDWRYAIDASRIADELGWRPRESFESGLEKTVRWYLDHGPWWERIRAGVYRGERLGLS